MNGETLAAQTTAENGQDTVNGLKRTWSARALVDEVDMDSATAKRASVVTPATPCFPPPGTPMGRHAVLPVTVTSLGAQPGIAEVSGRIEDALRSHPSLSHERKEFLLLHLSFLKARAYYAEISEKLLGSQ